MDRYMVHLENSRYGPHDARTILVKSRELTQNIDRVIRDVRVASSHVELDVSVDSAAIDKITEQLNPVGKRLRARHIIESDVQTKDAIHQGVEHFNSERFWESHESFEGVWRDCTKGSTERDATQGIILAAAALVHYQKDEDDIALSILHRAAQKLCNSPPECCGIDIDAIRTHIDDMITASRPAPFMIRPSLARS